MSVRRWLLRGAVGSLALLLVGGVASWLAFQHVPGWYKPVHVAPQHRQVVKNSVTRAFNEFSEKVNQDGPFEFRLTAKELNRWLAVRDEFGPDAREMFPPWLSEPMVIMQAGRVGFAGIVNWESVRSVVSLWFTVDVAGDELNLRLAEVRGGVLPVPASTVLGQVRGWISQADDDEASTARRLRDIEQLLAGKSMENRLFWQNGERDYRILKMTLADGEIRLTAQAIPRSTAPAGWTDSDQESAGVFGLRLSK